MRRTVLLALILWLLSLAAGAAALFCAEFGAPPAILLSLLGWLLSVGLPTAAAVVLVIQLSDGPIVAFLVCASVLGFVFQLGSVWLVGRLVRRVQRG